MLLLIPSLLIVSFVYWILYHLLIRRDLKNHLTGLTLGFTFIAIWAIVYFAVLN